MKFLSGYLQKIALVGLLFSLLVLSACASQATAPTTDGQFDEGQITPTTEQEQEQTKNPSSDGLTFVYAGVEIKITKIEQAEEFPDDKATSSELLMRLSLRESNMGTSSAGMSYYSNWRLQLPGGESIAPKMQKESGFIDKEVTRDNWIDFPIDKKQDFNTVKLRVGAADEQQIEILLNGKGDMKKYQPESIAPNSIFKYGTSEWTVLKVTSSLSAKGEQAKANSRFITVELKADNNGSKSVYLSPSKDVRLKTKSVLLAPESENLPFVIEKNSKGASGSVVFHVPANETDLTLHFLAQSNSDIEESKVSFKL